MPIRFLTASDVRRALPMPRAIEAMREAFTALACGDAELPHRTAVQPAGAATMSLTMPAALRSPPRMGAKLLTLNPENAAHDRPVIHGLVVMFDPTTGAPEGLVEGTSLTVLRTGAVCGLATDLLAPVAAECVAVIGAGAQAAGLLEAVCAVRTINRARVWSRSADRARRLADRVRGRPGFPPDVEAVPSLERVTDGADVICTATPATEPVLGPHQLSSGVHVNAIGSYTPDMRELSPDVVAAARIVVDHREAALVEAGELIASVAAGLTDPEDWVELGDVVMGRAAGRTENDQVTVFKSVGLAVQDLSAAGWALERAGAGGIGIDLALDGADQ